MAWISDFHPFCRSLRKRLGLQEVFFQPSPHSLVFSGGQPCGPVHRATAVQFRCGVEEKVMRLEEVKTCMYLAEVQHPGAQKKRSPGW